MAEKVVSVRLQARVEGFTAGMRKAKASVDDLTKADVPKSARGFKDLGDKAALAGAAVAVGLGVAVKRFADFDKAMSAVRANTGATAAEMQKLTDAAIKLGADSQFSATEAAQGVNELAKAGVATADILGGGLKGSLDLAAAGQIEVAQAAETTASAMTQFKLSGDQATHVADLLASGANKAQGGVGDLGAALGQAGLVAAATGLSIEETTAGLTAFASAGLIGSDAGTSFKTMLQRLSAPMGPAAEAMKNLGISAYDSAGNFVGLAGVAEQLKTSMEDLTPAQRNAAMATIFGSDAVRASNILYNEGAAGINKWIDAVDETGAASKQAATLTDNLSGDLERLGGAFDSVLIETGSGANASLRTLVQGLEGLVTTVGKIPGPVLLAGAGLAAIALVVPKGLAAFKNYQATLESVGLSFDRISARSPRTARGLRGVETAAKGAVAALAMLKAADLLQDNGDVVPLEGFTKSLVESGDAIATLNAAIKKMGERTLETDSQVTDFGSALDNAFNPNALERTQGAITGTLESITGGFVHLNSETGDAAEVLALMDSTLAGLVSSGNAEGAATLLDQFGAAAADNGVSVDQLLTKLPTYTESLAGVDNAAASAAGSSGELAGATEDVQTTADQAKDALDALKDSIDGLGSAAAQQRAAERDYQAAIDDSAARVARRIELERELKAAEAEPAKTSDERKRKAEEIARITEELAKYSAGVDVNTEAGRANQTALDAIAAAAKEKVKADIEAAGGAANLEAATKAGTTAMQQGRDAFIEATTQAGMTKAAAKTLADQLGLIPKNVTIAVSQSGAATVGAAIDAAAKDRTAVITVKTVPGSSWDIFHPGTAANQSWDIFHPKKTATGGAIRGPGTGTSDTAGVYALSNGEHVWTAAEVAKLGGQSAMYALRAAVRQGRLPGMADGGAVRYAPPSPFMSMSAGATSVTETTNAPVYIGSVTGPTLADIEREARQRARFASLTGGNR